MTVAMCWLYVVGAPTGFFLGAGLPWACVVAFGALAGFLTAFLLVSGITRNPHVNERMNVSVFDSLSLRQPDVDVGIETDSVLFRFRFVTQLGNVCAGALLCAILFVQCEVRNPHPKHEERNEHYTNHHLLKQ
jgi:hypothetical protein